MITPLNAAYTTFGKNMKSLITLLLVMALAQAGRAGTQLSQIPEAGSGAYILCIEYSFDDEHAFEKINLRKADRLTGRMLSETRSWLGDRSPKGKYLGVFLIVSKDETSVSESDFEGLPVGTKFNYRISRK